MSRLVSAAPKAMIIACLLAVGILSAGDALRAEELTKEQLRKKVLEAKGIDAARRGENIPNPFTNLTAEGKAKLKKQGVDVERLVKLKAVLITGNSGGPISRTLVNRDPDTILVLDKGFITEGKIYSLGPVLAVGDAYLTRPLTGASLVWFVEKAYSGNLVRGAPLLVSSEAWPVSDEDAKEGTRHGDYGWRRPGDFLEPAPLPLPQKLAALWAKLDDSDADRAAQTMRKLLAHEKHFLPYLKERLRLPPRSAKDQVGRLLDDLDSERYATRQAASQELVRLGLLAEPELLLTLQTRPSLEMRRRIEQILEGIRAEKKRIRRALQALEEMDPLGSRQLLEELVEGDADLFVTREAKAVLSRGDQRNRK